MSGRKRLFILTMMSAQGRESLANECLGQSAVDLASGIAARIKEVENLSLNGAAALCLRG